jgi:putative flavoprotein involved in K+ transport
MPPDGHPQEPVDAVIWCTGFRPVLRHLAPLRLRGRDGRVPTAGAGSTRSVVDPRVYLVGYGDWTRPASATLLGVGRAGRDAAADIVNRVKR